MNTAVFASGRGSNLEALIHRSSLYQSDAGYYVSCVVVDKPECRAAGIAQQHNIPLYSFVPVSNSPSRIMPHEEEAITGFLNSLSIEMVVLAGFMRILRGILLHSYQGRMINIHPSLLPDYPGLNTHQRVLFDKAYKHGCTVHWVTEEVDCGPVIAQQAILVPKGASADDLAERVLALEHRLLPKVLNDIALNKLKPASLNNCS